VLHITAMPAGKYALSMAAIMHGRAPAVQPTLNVVAVSVCGTNRAIGTNVRVSSTPHADVVGSSRRVRIAATGRRVIARCSVSGCCRVAARCPVSGCCRVAARRSVSGCCRVAARCSVSGCCRVAACRWMTTRGSV
jgi:hypothetical protein